MWSVVLLTTVAAAAGAAPGLPWPLPSTVNASSLVAYDGDSVPGYQQFSIATLQGVVGRTAPGLFWNKTGGNGAELWLAELQKTWGVRVDVAPSGTVLLETLLQRFRSSLPDGFVLYDANQQASVSAAASAVGILDAVAIDSRDKAMAESIPLKQALSVINSTSQDVWKLLNNTRASFSLRVAVIQDPTKLCCLWDAAAQARAPVWWSTTYANDPVTEQVMSSLTAPSSVLGWGTSEFGLVSEATRHGAFVNAADWGMNLGTMVGFPSGGPFVQPTHPTPSPPSTAPKRHTIAFLMSDGDNLQWLLNTFPTGPAWWGSPLRGRVPMGWTLSPALASVAPAATSWLYSSATPRSASACDVFVAGPSGAGYAYPDLMSPGQLATFASATEEAMKQAGQSVVNIIGDDYTAMAGEAMAGAASRAAGSNPGAGVIWYDYDPYDGLKGNLTFFNGVPVIGARFQLWQGFDTPESVINGVLSLPADSTTADGYSLVVVQAWTSNLTQVGEVIDGLKEHPVDVVCPDELLARVSAYVKQ